MKKLFIFCISSLLALRANAQLPNPGFEIRKADGTAANWLPGGFMVIPVDSNCIRQGWDSIQTSTHDAHSGNYACEVRVATVCGDAYSGIIQSNRIDSDGFFDQRIPISGQPSAFTFYYKLYSVQGDFGVAEAFMENDGAATGEGQVQLPAAATWTKAMLPVSYTVSDTGGFLRLKFHIGNATVLHYGTRFVIDDIGQVAPTGVAGTSKAAASIDCFPSPAQNSVSIRLSEAGAGAYTQLTVTDMAGRIVVYASLPVPQDKTFIVDTRSLAPGVYYVRLSESNRTATGRFVK